jgi:uroporphyrinogen III methyltransferase/synthase
VTVHLVGAGPGDPGLLTRRGAELLATADVVVHDRLVDPAVLALASPRARLIDVGKPAGRGACAGHASQARINALLVAEARHGATVVRLKGGDPFLFGRGGEEALALEQAGVAYEVVPGVSSAFAVPAAAGVPVTHRGLARSVSVLSGHDLAGSGALLEHLSAGEGTIVVLMSGATHRRLAERLVAAGRRPSTPVLVVERGTTPEQRSWRGTIEQLAAGDAASFASPALIVVGEVASLALASYEQRALAGWRVVVTRAEHQARTLVTALGALGARPVELPVISLAPPLDGGAALAAAAARLAAYDWVVFTSTNAVERFLPLLRDARSFGAARVAAIGPGTAAALGERGVLADLVPPRFVAEALLEVFPAATGRSSGAPTVLLPRAAEARQVLPQGLRRLGYSVDVVEAYRTVRAVPAPGALEALENADAVTFTSSSTVRSFVELAGRSRLPPVVASIGPVTSATAAEAGLSVTVEAETSTIAGLVEALALYARRAGRPGARAAGAALGARSRNGPGADCAGADCAGDPLSRRTTARTPQQPPGSLRP